LFICVLSGFTSCVVNENIACLFLGYSCPPPETQPPTVYYSQMPPKSGDSSRTNKSGEKRSQPKVRGILSNLEFGPTINFKSAEEEYFDITHKPGIGFHFYAGSYWPLSNNLSLHPAIGYKQARAFEQIDTEGEYPGSLYTRKDEFVFNTLSVPVVLDYKLRNNRTSFFGGPELSYLLSSRLKRDNDPPTKLNEYAVRTAAGLQAGVLHRFPLRGGSRFIGAQLKFDKRLSRLNSRSNPVTGSSPWYMSSIHLGLTYSLCNCY
jgi:hypothetical protein